MYDHILSRIRKILTKAENPAATPEEAEAHTAKAAELIAKYGIDHALLAVMPSQVVQPGDWGGLPDC